MRPRQYFTKARIRARRKGQHPAVLFHFTPRSRALKILEEGVLRGYPVLSLTENPAFVPPGPAVFALDAGCVVDRGYELWPELWQRGAEEEAEWIVVPRGTEKRYELPHAVELPVRCVRYVGLIGRFGLERERILELAQELGIPGGDYDWEEWWEDGPTPKMTGPMSPPPENYALNGDPFRKRRKPPRGLRLEYVPSERRIEIEAILNSKVIAYATALPLDEHRWAMSNIEVFSPYKRRGIGTLLYAEILRRVEDRGMALCSSFLRSLEAGAFWRKHVAAGNASYDGERFCFNVGAGRIDWEERWEDGSKAQLSAAPERPKNVHTEPEGSIPFTELPDDTQDDVVASLSEIILGEPNEEVRIGLENGPSVLPLVWVDPNVIFDGTRTVSEAVVEAYAQAFREGEEFPPVVIDSSAPPIMALIEGGHRTAAAVDAQVPRILAIDLKGAHIVRTPEGLKTYAFARVRGPR